MKKIFSFFLVAISAFFTPPVYAGDKPTHPVVLIPGILGSKLCDSNGKVLWGKSARGSLNNFASLQVGDRSSGVKPCGIVDEVQVLGPLYSVAAYSSLLQAMRGWQLVEGQNLHIFDYDWRLSNSDNARLLANFVDEKLGNKNFNIVAHSMGGVIARLYLDNATARERVKKVVYLGTPFLGSMNTLGTLSEGWGRLPNWLAGGVDAIRRTALSFPALLELLPRYKDCCSFKLADNNYQPINIFDPVIWKDNAWLPQGLRSGNAYDEFSKNLKHAATLSDVLSKPVPGVIEVKFASDSRSTRFIFATHKANASPSAKNWHFSSERGDGTVPAWSAARASDLTSLAGALPSFGEHSTIFDDDWVRSELKRELFTANAVLDRPIGVRGQPTVSVQVDGQSRQWALEHISISPSESYLPLGENLSAAVTMKFSGNSRDLRSGVYKPAAFLRQGDRVIPLDIAETTSLSDAANRQLKFECRGGTGSLAEGVAQIVIELRDFQPTPSPQEFVVLMK